MQFCIGSRRLGFRRPFRKQMEKYRASLVCVCVLGEAIRAEGCFTVALETFGDSSGQDFTRVVVAESEDERRLG